MLQIINFLIKNYFLGRFLMKLVIPSGSKFNESTDCHIAMVSQKGMKKKQSKSAVVNILDSVLNDKIFQSKKSAVLFMPCTPIQSSKHLLLVGLGDSKKVNEEVIRQISATAYRALEKHSITSAVLDCSSLLQFINNPRTVARLVTEGFYLAHYCFDDLKKKEEAKLELKTVFLTGLIKAREGQKGLEEGQCLAENTNFGRWLADHPANLMTPSILAQSVQKKCKGIGNLKVSVWDKARIKKEKMGGLIGVSLGSNQEPRVIIMEYKGARAKSSKPVCFVGKGLTFDSGGISIKPARNMDEMKFDMCGSVAVIGAMLAIAQLKLKVNVIGLIGSTENMLGAAATKPGDVLRARNGKTMEVLNTDAEGRLVLADILSYASELKPVCIVDAATLTGAVVVALGNIYTGLFTRNKELKKKIHNAGKASGERLWSMPLDDFNVKDIKSPVADVANIQSTQGMGSSTAAAFLEHFVDTNIPWAHLDIAGTAWNIENRLPYGRPKSASGVMVRTFVEFAKQYSR